MGISHVLGEADCVQGEPRRNYSYHSSYVYREETRFCVEVPLLMLSLVKWIAETFRSEVLVEYWPPPGYAFDSTSNKRHTCGAKQCLLKIRLGHHDGLFGDLD